jgi:hypothetical protein
VADEDLIRSSNPDSMVGEGAPQPMPLGSSMAGVSGGTQRHVATRSQHGISKQKLTLMLQLDMDVLHLQVNQVLCMRP